MTIPNTTSLDPAQMGGSTTSLDGKAQFLTVGNHQLRPSTTKPGLTSSGYQNGKD